MNPGHQPVVCCIPYFRCPEHIAPAVESVLNQSRKELILVVVNDADSTTPPWPALSHISDPRLVRFDLEQNHGPYFAIQVALAACRSPYLLVQDADDWSHPDRLAQLWTSLEQNKTDLAITDRKVFTENTDGSMAWARTDVSWNYLERLDGELKFRISHHGLFRRSTLELLGGYYGGFRISYDMYLTNLLLLAGQVSVVHQPLYYYYKRASSLTVAGPTGMQSRYRAQVNAELQEQYSRAYSLHLQYASGSLSSKALFQKLAELNQSRITPADKQALAHDTGRLKELIY